PGYRAAIRRPRWGRPAVLAAVGGAGRRFSASCGAWVESPHASPAQPGAAQRAAGVEAGPPHSQLRGLVVARSEDAKAQFPVFWWRLLVGSNGERETIPC